MPIVAVPRPYDNTVDFMVSSPLKRTKTAIYITDIVITQIHGHAICISSALAIEIVLILVFEIGWY